ncbi:MAG: SPOR domain-containing protein [Congregibacter sp.]|nr:SPOR domain-containing protein [Congregibacter sp.]
MAEDNNDPTTNAKIDADQDNQPSRREVFIDRDDDSRSPFVDRDGSDEFPESELESEHADPGYAAFADEFDDPLADWPGPDASLDKLPERRQQKATDDEEVLTRPASAPVSSPRSHPQGPEFGANNFEANNDLAPKAEDDTPVDFGRDNRVFDGDSDSIDSLTADVMDRDDWSPNDDGDEDDEYEDEESGDDLSEDLKDSFEEEFVDDFLNDLDPPDDELPAVESLEEDEDYGPSMAAIAGAANTVSSSLSSNRAADRLNKATPFENADVNDADIDNDSPRAARGSRRNTAADSEERTLPLGMIAVVIVALILLGIGGFGVVQQRGELQAEIRDLQATLATTMTPQQAEVEREEQRQVQLQNESLSTELEALTAENDALALRLAELESTREAQVIAAAAELAQEEAAAKAAAERAAEAEKAAAAEQASAQQQAAAKTRSSVTPSTAKGPWFVNFGSYADQTIADRWAKKLAVDDGQVVVQSANAGGKTLYRVRVISLASQDSAERVATALERQYQLPRLWVGKN